MSGEQLRKKFANARWVLLPLEYAQADPFVIWINRCARNEPEDDLLAKRCVEETNRCITKSGLQYNSEEYGELNAECLVVHISSDYLAMPEAFFVHVPGGLGSVDSDPADPEAIFSIRRGSSVSRWA